MADRLELPAVPQSVSAARGFVVHALREWGMDGCIDLATLLTSELTTNVVLHARTPFAVTIRRTADGARIDVLDRSTTGPRRRPHSLAAHSGRGLALVDLLATSWGATDDRDLGDYAKGVWFTVG